MNNCSDIYKPLVINNQVTSPESLFKAREPYSGRTATSNSTTITIVIRK